VAAYRKALRCNPASGEGWSCLASLKTYRFADSDLVAMEQLGRRGDLSNAERQYLEFALGRAHWQRGDDAVAFGHYARAKAMARASALEDPDLAANRNRHWIEQSIAAWASADGLTEHPAGAPIPIFVVGLPRSGTTLVEQILGSHPQVEATSELPCLERIARRLMDAQGDLTEIDVLALANEYIEESKIYRKTRRPFFVDKQPINYRHIALIKAILPQARIVEVRRGALANCVAMFRQHFLGLPEYAGSLADIAQARRDYEEAMACFEHVLPGASVRIEYEALVADTESEIRRLLDALALPFEEACLTWYANGQPVRTPSSEQVRQPIYRDALEEWRRFEPWLGEAKAILEKDEAWIV